VPGWFLGFRGESDSKIDCQPACLVVYLAQGAFLMNYPYYQRDNRKGARFGINCGESFQAELICLHCGHINPQSSQFCDECGDHLLGVSLDNADRHEETLVREEESGAGTRLSGTSNQHEGDSHQNLVTDLEEAVEKWTIARGKVEKAAEQMARLMPPSPVDSTQLQSYRPGVPGKAREADKIKVFVVDRQIIFRQYLRRRLSETQDIEVTGESEDFSEDVASLIEGLAPDVAVVDTDLPSLSGLDLAREIIQRSPSISLIMLTPYRDDNQILRALKAGVAGYLSKDITGNELASAIRRVSNRERIIIELLVRPAVAQQVLKELRGKEREGLSEPVSHQEMKILGYFTEGYSPKQVANAMGVSEQEITMCMVSIVSKLVTKGCAQ